MEDGLSTALADALGAAIPVDNDVPQSAERPAADGPSFRQAPVLADIVVLMVASPQHRHLFLADLDWLVLPPLALGQCRLFRRDGRPFAYVSWAYLDEDGAARMTAAGARLRPSDWKSGEQAWIIDVVAPFGGGDAILREIKARNFPDQKVKALLPAPDGKGVAVVEW